MDFKSRYRRECLVTGTSPLHAIEASLSESVLNFKFFRIPINEWNPILSTMKNDASLRKIIIKIDYNDYTINNPTHQKKLVNLDALCADLSSHLSNNASLNELKLIGLPLSCKAVSDISQGVLNNSSIKHLSLSQCKIGDDGVIKILEAVQTKPNIVWLDLSCCDITSKSGDSLRQLIHSQSIRRKNAAWKGSLREGDLSFDLMGGLRRLTLNDNQLGDSVKDLASAFHEDQWMKAIDLQFCRLDDYQLNDLLQGVAENQSLNLVDVRNNPNLNPVLVEKLNELIALNCLNKSKTFNFQPIEIETGGKSQSALSVPHRRDVAVLSNRIKRDPKRSLARPAEKIHEAQTRRASFSPKISVKVTEPTSVAVQVKDTSKSDELAQERQLRLTAERQVIKMYTEMDKGWSRVSKLERKIQSLKKQCKCNLLHQNRASEEDPKGIWVDPTTLEAFKLCLAQLRTILRELKITAAPLKSVGPTGEVDTLLGTLRLAIHELTSRAQGNHNGNLVTCVPIQHQIPSSSIRNENLVISGPSQHQTTSSSIRKENLVTCGPSQHQIPSSSIRNENLVISGPSQHQTTSSSIRNENLVISGASQHQTTSSSIHKENLVICGPSQQQRPSSSMKLIGTKEPDRIVTPEVGSTRSSTVQRNLTSTPLSKVVTSEPKSTSESLEKVDSNQATHSSKSTTHQSSADGPDIRLASLKNLKIDLEGLMHQFRPLPDPSFAQIVSPNSTVTSSMPPSSKRDRENPASKSLEYSMDFDSTSTSIRSISLKSNANKVPLKDSRPKNAKENSVKAQQLRATGSQSSSTLNLSSIIDLLGDYSLGDVGDSTLTPP